MHLIKNSHSTALFISLLLFIQPSVFARDAEQYRKKIRHELPNIQSEIEVDGNLFEDVWKHALVIELNYETKPGENIRPPEKTKVFLFENGETLFVAFDAQDKNPNKIRAFLQDRDNIWNSDFVGIKFDTFGESRKAFQFFTNAKGIQADAIQEDFVGDDNTWDAIWESSAKINENGYHVEMAIPFKALRFPDSGKAQSWGIEILRFLPREKVHRIANSPSSRNIACSICQYDQLVGFADIKESNNLQLIPTLTLGKSQSRSFDDEGISDPWQNQSLDKNVGLDLRWGITPETYLNATFNPDFSQVEADAAQIDVNNNFSLFIDEKRPFFLDGIDYFSSPSRLVHTRDLVSPDYGVKITGQTSNHSYGFISVKDQITSFLLPGNQGSELLSIDNLQSENQILRYNYNLGNKSTMGGLITHKTAGSYSNNVTSFDGKYWFNNEHSITYQLAHTTTHYSDVMVADYDLEKPDLSGDAFILRYDYQTRNWVAKARYFNFDKDFRADLGFIGKVDFSKGIVGLKRIWFPQDSKSWWTRFSVSAELKQTVDSDRKLLSDEWKSNLRFEARYQSSFKIGTGRKRQEWNGIYYDENINFVSSSIEPYAGLKFNLSYDNGNKIDFVNDRLGKFQRISPSIDWQVNENILTKINYSKEKFEVENGKLFDASITNLRLSYLFDERNSLRVTFQQLFLQKNPLLYNSFSLQTPEGNEDPSAKSVSSQILYTYRVNPQTLVFMGVAGNGFLDRRVNQLKQSERRLFMKFSYAWQL